jgi:hypothetical protein
MYPRNLKEGDIEDTLTYYKTTFVPMIQAARKNGKSRASFFIE